MIESYFKMAQSRPLFVYIRPVLIMISITQIGKSVDGVLGIRTQGCRIVGADKITELWRPPQALIESFICMGTNTVSDEIYVARVKPHVR